MSRETLGLAPFPGTHWSLVGRAGRSGGAARREALQSLLVRYQLPLVSHLRLRLGFDADTAADVFQGFVQSQVLEKELLANADRDKGRFRTFLLTALDRYAFNWVRADAARARSIPTACGTDAPPVAAPDAEGPDRQFTASWARQVVSEALARMRQECDAHGRPDVWAVFDARVSRPILEDTAPVPYAELVDRHHFVSPAQASNVLITGKRMFVRILRRVVGEYEREDEVDSEIATLRTLLSEGGA
jgi:RNA polymerase sigma-70 factor (ECF subfamily)